MTSQLSGRIAVLLSAVAVMLVLIVGWFVLISPERSKVTELDGKISTEQTTLAQTQAYVKSPANKKLVKELAKLKAVLPDNPQMSQILRQLSATSAASGVQINSISPGAAIAAGGGQAIPVAMSVEGHYSNISRFLNILRTKAQVVNGEIAGKGRLYSVDSLNFASGSGATAGGGSATTLNVSVALNVYTYGTPVASPTAPATGSESTDTSTTAG